MFGMLKKKAVQVDDGLPTAEWIWDHMPLDTTSDIRQLEEHQYQLMFVYNQMQRGHRMYQPMLEKHSIYLGSAFTAAHNFTLWKKKLGQGTYPIPLRVPMTIVQQGRIKGELMAVRPYRYLDLDNYMSNGVEFRRKKVDLLFPYRYQHGSVGVNDEEFLLKVSAWTYIGRYNYWKDFIDAGYHFGKTRMFTPNHQYSDGLLMGDYYCFTQLEYD
jgi:hypothetical protein